PRVGGRAPIVTGCRLRVRYPGPRVDLRQLGNSGLKVSAIGLGGNTFGATVDGDEAVETIRRGLDAGITFIDTADMYSHGRSEESIRQAVASRQGDGAIATETRHPLSASPDRGSL